LNQSLSFGLIELWVWRAYSSVISLTRSPDATAQGHSSLEVWLSKMTRNLSHDAVSIGRYGWADSVGLPGGMLGDTFAFWSRGKAPLSGDVHITTKQRKRNAL